MGKKGLNALDDTHKYIKWTNGEVITKREAFKRFYAKRGQDLTTVESGVTPTGTSALKYIKEATPFINLPGAAWLSSARVVRCWVKSRNERNPFPYLPAG